jgi:DNA-binding MarR family transcriptional regulator
LRAKLAPISPCGHHDAAPASKALNNQNKSAMKLFATLKKIREFERLQLPFITSLIDFDLIIEIGYAQEEKKPLTPKQLFLLNVSSVTTARRRLAKLTELGIVMRRTNANDHRSDILTLSTSSLKLLGKYGHVLAGILALA